MAILLLQSVVLLLLAAALLAWWRHFPYPSPVARPLLPREKRWPERQIRGWLSDGGFHPGFLRYFYRDPERVAPPGATVLAPADGLITSLDARDGIRYIVIALSFWDMHVQRSPLAGRVVSVAASGDTFTDGEGRDFAFLREKTCPVQTRIVVQTAIGTLAVRLITSVAARRIEAWVKAGDELARGQRIGRILLGSTVVLEIGENVPPAVAPGQRVRAGQSSLAAAPPGARR